MPDDDRDTSAREARLVAIALIEEQHVAHDVPSVLEMAEIERAIEARPDSDATPEEIAHDTLVELGWRVTMVDGVIYPIER